MRPGLQHPGDRERSGRPAKAVYAVEDVEALAFSAFVHVGSQGVHDGGDRALRDAGERKRQQKECPAPCQRGDGEGDAVSGRRAEDNPAPADQVRPQAEEEAAEHAAQRFGREEKAQRGDGEAKVGHGRVHERRKDHDDGAQQKVTGDGKTLRR